MLFRIDVPLQPVEIEMPLPIDQRVKFFVFVIESPSAPDLYHRVSEGEVIKNALALNSIHCVVKTAISIEAFNACLKIGIANEMELNPQHIPILHISAHGNAEGIQLSDGYMMSWAELKEHLRPLNAALNNFLIVCMSSCEGYAGVRMAMHNDQTDLSHFALIGSAAKPTWGETAVGYATFYHQLSRGEYIHDAVEAMKIASGNKTFFLEHAANTQKSFIEHIRLIDSKLAVSSLENNVANESVVEQNAMRKLL